MNMRDRCQYVLRALVFRPLRSALTLLGIAIGIFAVALLTALGEGLKSYVLESFSQFGSRIVAVTPGTTMTAGLGGLLASSRPLTLDDARALARLPYTEAMVPVIQGAGELQWGRFSRAADIIGVSSDVPHLWRFEVGRGRFLPPQTRGRSSPYVVVGAKLADALFGAESPLGQRVRIGGMGFRVIGVMAPKGRLLGFDLDEIAYIPVDLAQQLFNREGLMEVDLLFAAATDSQRYAERVRRALIERHGREDFTLTTQDEMLASLDRILGLLSLGVGALGLISLFVGGVGVVTIMTTCVQERRGEIGLLVALGARSRAIQQLFLLEAMVLAGLGGLLGLLLLLVCWVMLGWLLPQLPVTLEPHFLLAALLLSLLVGGVSGWGPARQAAAIDPIEALHDL